MMQSPYWERFNDLHILYIYLYMDYMKIDIRLTNARMTYDNNMDNRLNAYTFEILKLVE